MTKKYKIIIIIFGLILAYISIYTIVYYFISKDQIVIGTKNFTEGVTVGYLLEDIIEDNTDYEVRVLPGIGETSFLQQAILKGDIDLYVDYTSTGFTTVLNQTYNGQSREYIKEYVTEEYDNQFDLSWISFLGFNNSNVIICTDFCVNNNIQTLSDLAEYNGEYTFGAPNFFYDRSDGFNLLEETYGIDLPEKDKYSMDPSITYRALDSGQVDVGLGYTTDGKLAEGDYVMLEDDKKAYPIYDAGIVISNNFLDENPDIEKILKKTNDTISTEQMQELNHKVDIEGETPEKVADDFYNNVLKDELNNK